MHRDDVYAWMSLSTIDIYVVNTQTKTQIKCYCFCIFLFRASEDAWKTFAEPLDRAAGQHEGLDRVFRKHIKPKKRHENARLRSELIYLVLLV